MASELIENVPRIVEARLPLLSRVVRWVGSDSPEGGYLVVWSLHGRAPKPPSQSREPSDDGPSEKEIHQEDRLEIGFMNADSGGCRQKINKDYQNRQQTDE